MPTPPTRARRHRATFAAQFSILSIGRRTDCKYYKGGFDSHWRKPLDVDHFARYIERLFEQPKSPSEARNVRIEAR